MLYHGAKNKLHLNQTFDRLAWRLLTSTSTSAGKRRKAAATFEKYGSLELSVLQLESIKHRIKLIQSKTFLGVPWMKWLNIYLQWPWQQKWVQQLQGERWRTGLDEGLNTKQLDFFTDSFWVTFFRLDAVIVWEVTFWTWMRGVRGLKPCLSATSSTASSSCSWRCLVSVITYLLLSIHNFNTKE